jgi:hypothetical protein
MTAVGLRAYDCIPTMTLAMVHRSCHLCVVDDSAINTQRLLVLLEQSQKFMGAINHALYLHGIIVDTE